MKLISSILLTSPPFEYTGVVSTLAYPPFDIQRRHVFAAGSREQSVFSNAKARNIFTAGGRVQSVQE